MEGDEEVVVLRIEFRVDGGGVGLEDGGWEGGFVFAVGFGVFAVYSHDWPIMRSIQLVGSAAALASQGK